MAEGEYARDLIGYGRNPPHPRWPDRRAHLRAVRDQLRGGRREQHPPRRPASEAFLSEIVGAQPWPGQRHMSMELIYEYGSRAGFWRLWRMFTERSMPVTVFGVATAFQRNPEAVAAMKEADWEIASHGLKWIDYRDFSPEEERAHLSEAIRIHARGHGRARRSAGIRAAPPSTPFGSWRRRAAFSTRPIPTRTNCPIGSRTAEGRSSSCPIRSTPTTCASRTPQGFNAGDQFFPYLKDTFDTLYAEGETAPKMMSVGLHCRLVGRPGRAAALARFLDYVASHERVWVGAAHRHRTALDRASPPGQATASGGQPPERSPEPLGNPAHGGSHNG